jgi:hypothetical protein
MLFLVAGCGLGNIQSWASNLRRRAALAGVEHSEDLSAGSTRDGDNILLTAEN